MEEIYMDSKQIQYILKVAECKNITRASEQLFVSQPSLSHFISKAEEELGAKIFNRGVTPLALTQAGEHYIKTARMMLALEDNLKREIDDLNNCREGQIRLGLSDMRATTLLPFVLPEFKKQFPNIVIQTVETSSRNVEEKVKNGEVDMGIIPLYDYDKNLESQVLYEEELLLVSTEELPSEWGTVRSWVQIEEITNRDFVMLKSGNRIRGAMDTIFLEHGVKPRTIIESTNNMTVYMLASAGMGIAIVPEGVIRLMNPIRIPRVYSIERQGFRWNIGAIWRTDAVLNSAQQQLIRLLKHRYS